MCKKKILLVNLVIVGILFYLLNRFNIFINDDYFYSFIKGNGQPIESIGDVFQSQAYDYFNKNGRFTIHSIVQYFCGIGGMQSFWFYNTIAFIILLINVIYYIKKACTYDHPNRILVFFLFLLALSGIPYIYLNNIACDVNYLWTSSFILIFINMYHNACVSNRKESLLVNIALFIFSIFIGSLQESFSIGVSGALFLFYCFNFKKFKGTVAYLVSGLWIGTCVVTLSPANFLRFTEEGGDAGGSLPMLVLTRAYSILANSVVIDILLLLIILSFVKYRERTVNFIKNNILWIGGMAINSLFVVFIAYTGKHQLTSASLFAVILIIKWFLEFQGSLLEKYGKGMTMMATALLLLLYVPVYIYRHEVFRGHTELINSARSTQNGIVIAPEYTRCCALRKDWIAQNFTRQEIYKEFSKEGISLWLTKGKQTEVVTSILPDSINHIVSNCKKENSINENLFKAEAGFYFILRSDKNIDIETAEVKYQCYPNLASKIKSLISKSNPVITETHKLSELDFFEDADFYYFIAYDEDPARQIMNMEIAETK